MKGGKLIAEDQGIESTNEIETIEWTVIIVEIVVDIEVVIEKGIEI